MFTKYLRKRHITFVGGKGGGQGWKGSRGDGGFRGEKRDQRKGDAKIISDFLLIQNSPSPRLRNNKISHPGTGFPFTVTFLNWNKSTLTAEDVNESENCSRHHNKKKQHSCPERLAPPGTMGD